MKIALLLLTIMAWGLGYLVYSVLVPAGTSALIHSLRSFGALLILLTLLSLFYPTTRKSAQNKPISKRS